MTIEQAITELNQLDPDATIYAIEPWHPWSAAMIAKEESNGRPPKEALDRGMSYFLGVQEAIELSVDLFGSASAPPSSHELCTRLIQYALYDAQHGRIGFPPSEARVLGCTVSDEPRQRTLSPTKAVLHPDGGAGQDARLREFQPYRELWQLVSVHRKERLANLPMGRGLG